LKKTDKKHLAAGFVSGTISRSITHPLERVRLLHQTGSIIFQNKTISESLKYIYSEGGVRGLLKGNTLSCMHQGPFSACEFFFYEAAKNNMFPGKHRSELSFTQKLACGGFAGCITSALLYPLDMVKTFLAID